MRSQSAKRQFRTGLAWLTASALLAIASIGGWFIYSGRIEINSKPIQVAIATPKKDDIEVSFNETGIVKLGGQQTLKSPSDTTVEQVLVRRGSIVQKDQVLISLRDPNGQKEIYTAQTATAKAKLTLVRQQEKVEEAKIKVKDAEKQFKESQSLAERGFISASDLQQDKSRLDDAQSALRDAQIEQQKADLDLHNAQQGLSLTLQNRSQFFILSPIIGLVLELNVQPGDGVKIGESLLTLGNRQQELIELQLSTLNASKVRIGQTAKVKVIGPDSQIYQGRVTSLSPIATTGDSNDNSTGRSSGQPSVAAIVQLNQPSRKLIPGSQVSVDIILEARKNVVVLGLETIQSPDKNAFVWIQDPQKRAQKQPIVLGLQNETHAQIESGVNENDTILVPLETPLIPGSPVSPDVFPTHASPTEDSEP